MLKGHATVVGAETGKIIGYETRIKSCRVCESAGKKGIQAKEHSCRKNWSGSAKAMEADMVVSMVKQINNDSKVPLKTLVGDEDSAIISRVNKEVSKDIKKKSDSNHIKKILGNQLFSLKQKHKVSVKTIKYLQKLFTYMCKQNSGNPTAIVKDLEALYRHPFDDHSMCSSSWCRHREKSCKFSSLPFGKPLNDPNLQQSLKDIFSKYKAQADKLASLESTQVNENFNAIVSTKAPKNHHYCGSESLDFRVSAATSQKNTGYSYLVDVSTVYKFLQHSVQLQKMNNNVDKCIDMVTCTCI